MSQRLWQTAMAAWLAVSALASAAAGAAERPVLPYRELEGSASHTNENQRRWRGPLLALLLVPCVLMVGCIFPVGYPDRQGRVQFAPDGQTVAYVWLDNLAISDLTKAAVFSDTASVRWCSITTPGKQHSASIDSAFLTAGGDPTESHVHLVFSPDSRHLAAVGPRHLVMIELGSGKHWQMAAEGEEISSLAWLGNEEIVYAAHRRPSKVPGWYSSRTIWRQGIHDPPKARKALLHEDKIMVPGSYSIEWNLERWAPNGQYVVFSSSPGWSQRKLLSVATGEVSTIGRLGGSTLGVAWRRDGSAVFCRARTDEDSEAILVDPKTGRVRDFSAQFRRAFPGRDPLLDPVWTPDGKYVLTALGENGCLVGLDPWEVIPVGRRLMERHPWSGAYVEVSALPIAGWLRARYIDKHYVVNYSGNRLGEIENGPFWTCSPDGKRTAQVDEHKRVVIGDLRLPD
jgi:hypothetical protein